MIRPWLRWWLIIVVVFLVALSLAGCTKRKAGQVRALNSREASKLIVKPDQPDEEIKADPARLEAHADQLAQVGEWTPALFQYQRALSLAESKNKERIRMKIARVYLKSGRFAEAEQAFSWFLNGGTEESEVAGAAAPENGQDQLIKLGPRRSAVEEQTAQTANPAPGEESPPDQLSPDRKAILAEAYQGVGLARLALGEADRSSDALTAALEIDPGLWAAHNGLGIILNWKGRLKEAVLHYGRALAIRPNEAAVRNNLGLSFMLMGELALAESCFKRALEIQPEYHLAANNLALLYARLGRREEARRLFNQTVGLAGAHNNLGVLMAWQGQAPAAADEFRQAMMEMPVYYEMAGRHLGEVVKQPRK